jgi:hypothetical protein
MRLHEDETGYLERDKEKKLGATLCQAQQQLGLTKLG